jgi:tRNA (mo5U34)-methyltransferase
MSAIKRERRFSFGSVDVAIAMPERMARRIRSSRLYRDIVAPAASWLDRRGSRPASAVGSPGGGPAYVPTIASEPPRPGAVDRAAREIADRIAPFEWYHTIDLPHGVSTPGFVDHRSQLPSYGLPDTLEGLRCLDVATYDGYWAFEMERRGAAEVVAVDVACWADCDIPKVILPDVRKLGADRPTGAAFVVAHDILESSVQRVICNVYELSPERLGEFDLVMLSDLLLHLRDPQLALESVFSVCRGMTVVADVFNPNLEAFGDICLSQFTAQIPSETWWAPNVNTLRQMLTVAGFEPIDEVSRFVLDAHSTDPIHKVVLHGRVPIRHSWKAALDQAVEVS